jgi:early secretory antigenic target protein ESAT-6
MVDQISIDFQRLGATQQHVTSTATSMNKSLGDLETYLKPLTATWTGEASTQYQALQAKWDTAAADLNLVLGRIAAALAEANTQMQAAERKIASTF